MTSTISEDGNDAYLSYTAIGGESPVVYGCECSSQLDRVVTGKYIPTGFSFVYGFPALPPSNAPPL